MEEYVKAIEDANQAIKIGNRTPEVFLIRGTAYYGHQEYGKALLDLTESLKKSPEQADALYVLALTYVALEEPDKALESCDKAVEARHSYRDEYEPLIKAGAYQLKGDYKKALAEAEKLVARNPSNTQYLQMKANLLVLLNRKDEALDVHAKNIEIDGNNAEPHFNKGKLLFKQNKNKLALESFNRAIELAPKDRSYYQWRGCTFQELKNYPAAIKDFSRVIELDPASANAYKSRAIAFHSNNQLNESLADYRQALKLEPKDKETEEQIAELSNELESGAHATIRKQKPVLKSKPSTTAKSNPIQRDAVITKLLKQSASSADDSNTVQRPSSMTAEEQKAVPAHSVQTYSGSSFSNRNFDSKGHPIEP